MLVHTVVVPRREESEMWRKGKKRNDEEACGGDSDGARPSKRATKKDSDDSADDDIVACEISKNRRVAVRNWQGKIVVDIREFYVKDGKQLPGKKGISLPMDQVRRFPTLLSSLSRYDAHQWKVLRDHIDQIDEAVKEND